jgi:hypothetical protein
MSWLLGAHRPPACCVWAVPRPTHHSPAAGCLLPLATAIVEIDVNTQHMGPPPCAVASATRQPLYAAAHRTAPRAEETVGVAVLVSS